ncbi:MAG: DUF4093 domain-containing protein [Clostridia bacterium]|nr:DUF4093 domain-containing protein [Clostridia bacterium]
MVKLKEAVVVEGKYDAIRLRSVVDATVVTTDGFGIFRQPETMELLRRLAAAQGIVVLTDSDAAGFLIRDRISSALPPSQVLHAYAPEIVGKERRKAAPSKEGLLGVEGIDGERLLRALLQAGATVENVEPAERPAAFLTKARLYEDGLSGRSNSAALREALLRAMELPHRLSANRMIEVINALLTEEEYHTLLLHIKGEDDV